MKKNIRCILIVMMAFAFLSGGQSTMVLELSPTSVAVGRGFDLLDSAVPMTRSYSGLLGLKDKTEVGFAHSMFFIEGLSIAQENAYISLKKSIVPGIKYGVYVSYLNPGGLFIHKNSSGFEAESFKFLDIMFGLPIAFDVKSLNLKGVGDEISDGDNGVSDGMQIFLNSINAGVNLNYYSSKLSKGTANTFFADVNVSTKLKAGYIGMPRKMVTRADVEMERDLVLSNYVKSFAVKLTNLVENEDLNIEDKDAQKLEYEKSKEDDIAGIMATYDEKLIGIDKVKETQEKIFSIYNNDQAMMSKNDVESVISDAKGEIQNLVFIASNAIRINFDFRQKALVDNVNDNQSNISRYRSDFREICSNEELKSSANNFFDLYRDYVLDRYYKVIQQIRSAGLIKDEDQLVEGVSSKKYLVGSGDSWESISSSQMGQADSKKYLLRFNGMNENYILNDGDEINIPDQSYIDGIKKIEKKRNKILAKITDFDNKKQEYKTYVIKSNDSWMSIVSNEYGSDDEIGVDFEMLLSYNDLSEEDLPVLGQTIKLPIKDRLGVDEKKLQEFEAKKAELEDKIDTYEMSDKEALYFNNVISKMDVRTELFLEKKNMDQEQETAFRDLNNKLAVQYALFDKSRESVVKGLKKLSLRKELDEMSATDEREMSDAFFQYKKKERKLFKSLLITIYRSKKDMIEELKDAENKKLLAQKREINSIYDKKVELLKEDTKVAVEDAGDDAEKAAQLEADFEKRLSFLVDTERANELADAENDLERKLREYDWELELNELIYLSSDSKMDTIGVGFYARNLGVPTKYSSEKESLPLVVGGDFNYLFLKTEEHSSTFYLHFDYSKLQNVVIGSGLMYRALDTFEFRAGVAFGPNINVVEPSGLMGVMFDVGLMNVRVDACAKYVIDYGLNLDIGVKLIF